MSDINGTGKAGGQNQNQQDIRDLSEEYRKKREALIEKNENELQQVKEGHAQRLKSLRNNQEAVVNHIQKQNSDALKQQEALRQQGFTKTKEALQAEQARAKAERQKINQTLESEIKGKVDNHQTRLNAITEEQHKTYDREAKMGQKRMTEFQSQQAKIMEKERAEKQAQLEGVKKIYGTETVKAKVEGEKKLNDTREFYTESEKAERMRGQQAVTQTRNQYGEQIKNTHIEGDKTLSKQKLDNEYKINQIKQQQNIELDQKTKEHSENLKVEEEKFETAKKTSQMEFRKELINQKNEFTKSYDKNREQQVKVLDNQKQVLKEELWTQKAETMKQFGKYADKRDDPFYNLQNFETALQEDDINYYIHTKVPEHEKDNVSIRVKGDKVIVSGKRGFEDRVEKPDRTVTSNNFQSFREIIALDKPVIGKAVQEFYEPGRMTVKIPKNVGRKGGFGNV